MAATFYNCRCMLVSNYFLKKYNCHVAFKDRSQLAKDYERMLRSKGCTSKEHWNNLFTELEAEQSRRNTINEMSLQRKYEIADKYKPLHPDLYTLSETFLHPQFLDLVHLCEQDDIPLKEITKCLLDLHKGMQIYFFPVFTDKFCKSFVEEINHFENSPLPKGRPNSMNNYGLLINELPGMDEGLISPLREKYLQPLAGRLFPDWVGGGLDSHKAFTVTYRMGQDLDLDYHFDNAEVTLNVCLGKEFEDGELFFGNMRTSQDTNASRYVCKNKYSFGLFHRGQHMHGALPITDGERFNLIIWMRSSSIRNQLCPMCGKPPQLIPGVGLADGFTQTSVQG